MYHERAWTVREGRPRRRAGWALKSGSGNRRRYHMLKANPVPPLQVVADSIAARVAEALAHQIVNGELAPGARLMQERVAEAFRVSHVPVREAFRTLEAQGLLTNRPRCGVRVSELDPSLVTEVTEMRAALEGLALSHAMAHIRQVDLDAARRAIAGSEALDEIALWEAANRRFHLALTAPSAVPWLMAAIGEHHQTSARFLFATWKHLDSQPRSDEEHRAILDAVVYRRRARTLLQNHIREAGRALVARLQSATGREFGAA